MGADRDPDDRPPWNVVAVSFHRHVRSFEGARIKRLRTKEGTPLIRSLNEDLVKGEGQSDGQPARN
jgi:hypothetical protein